MTAREYTSEQLALEQRMSDLGDEREHRRYRLLVDREAVSTSKPGRALLRRYLVPCKVNLQRAIRYAQKTRPGRLSGLERLAEVGPSKVALIAVQTVVDGLPEPRPVSTIANAIGEAIEDEWRFAQLRRSHKEVWLEVRRRTHGKSKARRRRILLGMDKAMREDPDRPPEHAMPPKWAHVERRTAGVVALECALAAADPPIAEVENWRNSGKKTRAMLIATTATLEWLEDQVDASAAIAPLHLPTLDVPEDWNSPEGGGYLTELVLNRPVFRMRSKSQRDALDAATRPDLPVYRALNTLQRTRWKLNEPVRQVVEHLWETGAALGGLPGRDDPPIPPRPVGLKENPKLFAPWKRLQVQAMRVRGEMRARRVQAAQTRRVAAMFEELGGRFYFPHRCDFRGRIYPSPYYMQPQGPDLARGMLTFDESMRMTAEGWRWFLVHGANMHGAKGTLEERERFALELFPLAKKIHEDPVHERRWLDADDPWQFLAWCLEFGELDSPADWPQLWTRLPCHADGSNNGLQLYSLMTGDRNLARLTNAIPSEGGPHDVYMEVAGRATEKLYDTTGLCKLDREYAGKWRELFGDEGIPRAVAKRPVMTIAYNVSQFSATRYVRDWYVEEYGFDGPFGSEPNLPCYQLAERILGEVGDLCTGAILAMKWLEKVAFRLGRAGLESRWTSASGWPVVQHYRVQKTETVRLQIAGNISSLHFRNPDTMSRVAYRKQASGMPPNFVHSVDAAILHRVFAGWEGSASAVHDSFAAHAPRLPELLRLVRDEVARVTVEENPLESLRQEVLRASLLDPGAPPEVGEIDPDEVRQAAYMFS